MHCMDKTAQRIRSYPFSLQPSQRKHYILCRLFGIIAKEKGVVSWLS